MFPNSSTMSTALPGSQEAAGKFQGLGASLAKGTWILKLSGHWDSLAGTLPRFLLLPFFGELAFLILNASAFSFLSEGSQCLSMTGN